jgi:hypothetical protein
MGSRTDLKPGYTNARTALKLVADFSNHWKLLEKTYGYKSARIKVPYKQGADFWVHLNLIAQPRKGGSTQGYVKVIRDALAEHPEWLMHGPVVMAGTSIVIGSGTGTQRMTLLLW